MALDAAVELAISSDKASIAIIEAVDNATMAVLRGETDAPL